MIFQFSDGEFSDPIATSLKMWKKKNFLHAFFFSPPTRKLAERSLILMVRMVLSCIACCIFHIISIPFNCSNTTLRVAKAMIGMKVKMFVFCHVCFVSRIWRQNSSPQSLAFSHLRNRAEISHLNPRRN